MLPHNHLPWGVSQVTREAGLPSPSSSSIPVSPSLTNSQHWLWTSPPAHQLRPLKVPFSWVSSTLSPINNLTTSHRNPLSFLLDCSHFFSYFLGPHVSTTYWMNISDQQGTESADRTHLPGAYICNEGSPQTIHIQHLQVFKFHKCNLAKAKERRKAFPALTLKTMLHHSLTTC